ncbi:MAG: tRNA (adenosine(37)-N6)-threonylcarbamoyltransferase complex ATPase subunit type 1 TsaE [Silicimonas sp.]|nr:tRNA (adenosine(37)-N6)-threonylcarbamoyltransferase complex ATPase subunit type 1 TsaE [Silicimonas sp.]
MDSTFSFCVPLSDESDTTMLGRQLAALLQPGDTLLFAGSIGAGKTHLARAIIQARLAASGRREEVPSPTYTLVQSYTDGMCEIWHVDLYRITGPDEVVELGIVEAFESCIVLVEWPDRLGNLAPDNALRIDLRAEGSGRVARFAWSSLRWKTLLPALDLAS